VEFLIVAVLALLAIAAAAALGPRWGVAAPLLLVVLGIAVSLVPAVPPFHVEPEWVLAGVLPPLLYSASVSMPSMDFRREFTAIGSLSVVLVVVSSVVLGLFFAQVVPGLGLAWGIALGAIVSPTDAVATSIVKRLGVSPRVVAMLEGESLLNDATALVLLRAAIAGAAASVSLWSVVGDFAYAVAVAAVIGAVVGRVNLAVRARVADATVNTVLSFTVPFLASVPAEELGASGLVAAVVAGLITGRRGPRVLPPQHRLSDAQNWRAVELVLEGAVFLVMGLELKGLLQDVHEDHLGIGSAIAIAAGALLLTVAVRAVYVIPLLAGQRRRARRGERMKPRLAEFADRLEAPDPRESDFHRPGPGQGGPGGRGPGGGGRGSGGRGPGGRGRGGPGHDRVLTGSRLEQARARVRRAAADIEHFLAQPLGWREGTVVVWAGMRGAITLAAAQTLPEEAPSRPLLVLVAFLVASASLVLQGGTLPRLVAWVRPARAESDSPAERARLAALLAGVRETVPAGEDVSFLFAVIDAQRQALLDARDDGAFSAEALTAALAVLDADQIRLELRGGTG
jgi:CPA1 family monovalent cation:H+ antiporter